MGGGFDDVKNLGSGSKLGDLCDTALGAYDAEQTNRVSSCLWERGARHKRHPWRYGGSARPCALPRVWGRLHGSLLVCFRKDVAPV